MTRIAVLLVCLLALPVQSWADPGNNADGVQSPDYSPKCLPNDVEATKDDAKRDDKSAAEVAAGKPLHKAGVKLALGMICKSNKKCRNRHRQRVTKAVGIVVDACLEDSDVPKWMCLGLVANAANEGGMMEHPTCGGLSQKCVRRCDLLESNGTRRSCFIQCGLDQGIPAWRMKKVRKCNDRGTSRGPFQQKKGRIKECKRWFGPDYDPFSLAASARCKVRKLKRTAHSKHFPCRRSAGNRWSIAMKRVGAGPLVTVEKSQKASCHDSPREMGTKVCVPARKRVRIQQCNESSYAQRGLRYYKSCGAACRKFQRPATIRARKPQPKVDPKVAAKIQQKADTARKDQKSQHSKGQSTILDDPSTLVRAVD